MNARPKTQAAQLGFDALLATADGENRHRQAAKETAHLPATMEEALPFYRALIDRHHALMLAGDAGAVMRLRDDAYRLATKLNNYEPGILADDDAPGCRLDALTRAADGAVPLWGQGGSFIITCCGGMRVRIGMDGIIGIGGHYIAWLGFDAHAVEWNKPFLSETGYRSFVAPRGELLPGMTPDRFAAEVIAAHVKHGLKGKLLAIDPEYRRRAAERAE
jgi:hypothetical protein